MGPGSICDQLPARPPYHLCCRSRPGPVPPEPMAPRIEQQAGGERAARHMRTPLSPSAVSWNERMETGTALSAC
jgi:hypothetical protein